MKKVYFFSCLLFISGIISAQNTIVGFNLNGYQALSSFEDNISTVPVGLSVNVLKQSEDSPFSFGFEVGFAGYGCEEVPITFQGDPIHIMQEDGFLTFHGVVRYNLLEMEGATFYGEGKVGGTSFFSKYSPTDCSGEFEGYTDFHGTALNIAVGGGLLFNPTILNNYDKNSIFMIDLGATTNAGTSSEYGVINLESPNRSSMKSMTHYIDYKIGLVIKL